MDERIENSSRRRSREVTKPSMKTKIKRNKTAMILAIFIVLMLVFGSLYVVLNSLPSNNNSNNPKKNSIAVINTTMGEIKVELYEDKVPNTCENFIKLANDGFFNGLVFHRIANLDSTAPNTHIIQGGGFYPDGTQKQSPYGSIDLEINPDARHIDGAIAMARTNDPNSATSQFYICDGPQSFLNDNYAVFGVVIEDMNVVREVAQVQTGQKTLPSGQQMDDWPINNIIINSITIE